MRFSVAPMLDWTDKHCRYFYRLISSETMLWTEMITTKAILFGDRKKILEFEDASNKTVLQLGGNDELEMLECANIARDFGYKEININVGCPSNKVQNGNFGACLMQTPDIVAKCVATMQRSGLKISVKHRIGVDAMEGYDDLVNFISVIKNSGCNDFIIHARKAWFKGLSPKENRTVPPLDYDIVYQVKQNFPELNIIINGGIKTIDECNYHLKTIDGVMLGREVYHNPYLLSAVDRSIYKKSNVIKTREQILNKYVEYIIKQENASIKVRHMTRHILGLYHSCSGSKKFKRALSGKTVIVKHLKDFIKEL